MSASPPDRPRSVRARAVVAATATVVLALGVVACGATDDQQTATGPSFSYRPTIRTATTRKPVSKEASDEFDKAIEAARSSTSTALGASTSSIGSSTTTRLSSTTVTSLSAGGSPSSTVAGAGDRALTAEECKLFAQLVNFVVNIEPLIDPNDPAATAMRVADPVAKSQSGLDQLLAIAPAAVRGDVETVIVWLRALAQAAAVDTAAAVTATDNVRSWFATNCQG